MLAHLKSTRTSICSLFFHLSLIVPTLSGNYHHFFLVFPNHVHSIISDPFHQFCSVTRVGAVLFEESREERAGDMSCKFPRGPLGTPLSTRAYVCAKDPDQLYSSISHHKIKHFMKDAVIHPALILQPPLPSPTPDSFQTFPRTVSQNDCVCVYWPKCCELMNMSRYAF